MTMYSTALGLMIAACCICLPDLISAQGFSRSSGSSSGSSSVSGSRSVSFTENGKKVSIQENATGITVTINGKKVRVKNAAQLKEQYPEEYRLYSERMGAASYSGSAGGSASGSAGGSAGGSIGGQPGAARRFSSSDSESRSVTVMENGKKVSIAENKFGITVTVNRKRVRAKNPAELKKKSLEAYRLYEKHLRGMHDRQEAPDAKSLLRDKLHEMHNKNVDNPQVRNLIEQMLRNVEK